MTEKMEKRQCFLKFLLNSRFLAFRGCQGDESNSNFIQLLKLRGEGDRRILDWMKRKTDKYTAPYVQNEILKVMSHSVLRQISSTFRSAKFLAVMIDETTDISNKEQVVVCFRHVDENLMGHEGFVGLHVVESTEAASLYGVVNDVLLRLNLSTKKAKSPML